MWRKYVSYGINLLGFTHGNEEKHGDLPTLMAQEAAGLWREDQHREWHLGHYHKKKQLTHNPQDTQGGTRVQVLPSLSGTDAWHYRKGYVKTLRAAEAYLWNYTNGYSGHFSVNVREE
jgi:hypothetical protein